jgi:SAM-dependent methyltransferase
MWYEEWFSSDAYDLVYEHRDVVEAEQCIDLIEREVQPHPRAHIVDVGCGRGRHALILAKRGFDVTGLDLSPSAIDKARERADDAGLDVNFMVGDMREPLGTDVADGVVNLFTTFGYFEDDADNLQALRAMTEALRPGGWLVQDFLNVPYVHEHLVPHDERTTDEGVTIQQDRAIENGRINKDITIEHDGRTYQYTESVRLLTLYDLTAMYDEVGLEVEAVYGHYDGRTYTPGTPRCIVQATLG